VYRPMYRLWEKGRVLRCKEASFSLREREGSWGA